jgi:tRNA dimethylallyltransferase
MNKYNCIVVLGPTASGKTSLACQLAYYLDGEIISADSRQVYKGLTIGTGKDLHEYTVNGKPIAYHLIDIIEPEEQFYLHQFTAGLKTAFDAITAQKKLPIICGGTGMYLDALRKDFSFTQIKEDSGLRSILERLSKEELIQRLKQFPEKLIQHVDLNSKKRIIRGIEVADSISKNKSSPKKTDLPYRPYYIGVKTDIETRKKNISERLHKRMEAGLMEEVQSLLNKGMTHQRLELFGLEYKFVSYYLQNKMSKEVMIEQLQTAIFQFAKRQMTWFRKMEKEGVDIYWVDKEGDTIFLAEQIKKEFKI